MTRVLLSEDPPVVVSTDAGAYYCGHALWVGQRLPVSRDGTGRPRAGFLHVPGLGDALGRPPAERHRVTFAVVGRMLRGLLDELGGRARVLVTGFGSFGGISDNPTGAFVSSGELLRAARNAVGRASEERPADPPPAGGPPGDIVEGPRGRLELVSAVLPVSDAALDPGLTASLPRLAAACRPDAWIGLGVARRDDTHRIEVLPTDGGLTDLPGSLGGWRHRRGEPARTCGPANRWLADCYLRG